MTSPAAPRPFLSDAPLDLARLITTVQRPDRGGLVSFSGTVRDHHLGREVVGISYSAYSEMAERVAAEITAEITQRWSVTIAVEHRVGRLAVGDVAIAVVVAGAHRTEAFAACMAAVDAIKARVPIWKHEAYADGTTAWVAPTSDGVMESR